MTNRANPQDADAIVDFEKDRPSLPRWLTLVMAAGCGLGVANLYYNQPLLAQMGRTFHVTVRQVGFIPQLTQIGCAFGMLLFVPLGDITERRRLIIRLLCAGAAALCLAAVSPNLLCLVLASLAIGFTSVVPHLILPFAAQLSAPEQRGKVVGTVLSGLLIGVLLARTISGYIGALLGWRAMYVLAAGIGVGLAVILRALLPESVPSVELSYRKTFASILGLIREQPVLREAAAIGAMSFGAFTAFWTTLVFLLEGRPYGYHPASSSAGLFGLVGVVGAGIAPLVGRVADRRGPRLTLGLALVVLLVSYILFWQFGYYLWGLVLGVILMDFGVQAAHVSNQTRIYALLPEARSRLNTVYMVCYFIGGSLGSALGAYGWSVGQWAGVSLVGCALSGTALFCYFVMGSFSRSAANRPQ